MAGRIQTPAPATTAPETPVMDVNDGSVAKETANYVLVELEPPFQGKVYVPKTSPIFAHLGADDDWPAVIRVGVWL